MDMGTEKSDRRGLVDSPEISQWSGPHSESGHGIGMSDNEKLVKETFQVIRKPD